MVQQGNLFQDLPASTLHKEVFEDILKSPAFRLERIVSQGHASPEGFWYQQLEAEWAAVIEGSARLRFEDGTIYPMSRGDYVLIPAGVRHRVDWTDPGTPTIWLAIHFPS